MGEIAERNNFMRSKGRLINKRKSWLGDNQHWPVSELRWEPSDPETVPLRVHMTFGDPSTLRAERKFWFKPLSRIIPEWV